MGGYEFGDFLVFASLSMIGGLGKDTSKTEAKEKEEVKPEKKEEKSDSGTYIL